MNKKEVIKMIRNEAADRERLARYYKNIDRDDYYKINKTFAAAFKQCALIIEDNLTED